MNYNRFPMSMIILCVIYIGVDEVNYDRFPMSMIILCVIYIGVMR